MSERPTPAEQEVNDTEEKKKANIEAVWLAQMLAFCERMYNYPLNGAVQRENQPPKELVESGPEILELEEMFGFFEASHSIAELLLITDLTQKDAPKHPIREPAKMALIPIEKKLDTLKNKTNISPEEFQKLQAQYKRLSQAVGIINNNKVDHDR